MKWNCKATGLCYEQLKYECAELDRLEGKNIACEQCVTVNGFLKDIEPKLDANADEHMIEFYAFLIRVYTAGSNMQNPTLDRRD